MITIIRVGPIFGCTRLQELVFVVLCIISHHHHVTHCVLLVCVVLCVIHDNRHACLNPIDLRPQVYAIAVLLTAEHG